MSRYKPTGARRPLSQATRQKIAASLKAAGIRPSAVASTKGNRNRPRGAQSPSWRGGRAVFNGYAAIRQPGHPRAMHGYVYEHILVAEATMGRPLAQGEVVHHRDGNKRNNAPENLAVLASQTEHLRAHHRDRWGRLIAHDQRGVAVV